MSDILGGTPPSSNPPQQQTPAPAHDTGLAIVPPGLPVIKLRDAAGQDSPLANCHTRIRPDSVNLANAVRLANAWNSVDELVRVCQLAADTLRQHGRTGEEWALGLVILLESAVRKATGAH